MKKANEEKNGLRQQIYDAEKEVRRARDLLANKETENKNLMYLLEQENELSREKSFKEEEALRLLNNDLDFQLNAFRT